MKQNMICFSNIIHAPYVLDVCIDFVPLSFCVCYHAQVPEGGPSHHVFASAELGPREDSGSGGRALHSSV